MQNDLISSLSVIEKKFNKKISTNIHIADNLLDQISQQLRNKRIIIISDSQIVTHNKEYFNAIKSNLNAKSYILANPKCDISTANDISSFIHNIDLIIAFGSGTINDLCKYIAYQNNFDYAVIASAYSMNGYLSQNASITISKHKKTISAKAPTHAFFDLNLMNKSPTRLTKSGIFDVACSYLIENDWLLSSFLGMDSEYDPFYFDIQQSYLNDLDRNFDKLLLNQDNSSLLNLLIITGILMNFSASSKPASQGEHLIAHLLEMKNSFKKALFHGEQVLVGSVLSYQIQSSIAQHFTNLVFKRKPNINFSDIFPAQYADSCQIEYNSKYNLIKSNRKLDNLNHYYNKILPKIISNLSSTKKLFTKFSNYNISLKPSDYITDASDTDYCLNYASLIRNRFTHLDLLFHGKISE